MSETREVMDTAEIVRVDGGALASHLDALGGTDVEFARSLESLHRTMERFRQIKSTLLTPGKDGEGDYGKVPGTNKDTLFLSGAQKLCMALRLIPSYQVQRTADETSDGWRVHYHVDCLLHVGDGAGRVVGQGVGSANSWERKYRYREARPSCTLCGEAALMRSKYEDKETGDKGWYCNPRFGGCGQNLPSAAVEPTHGMIENPDPFDLDNTLLKMAKKRAFVDATIVATATSDVWTQDMEESIGERAAAAKEMRERFILRAKGAGVTKNQPFWAFLSKAIKRPILSWKEVEKLSVSDWFRAERAADAEGWRTIELEDEPIAESREE